MGYLTDALAEMRDHGFTDTTAARLTGLINDANWRISAKEPWNFLEATATSSLTPGTAALTMPANFSKATSLVLTEVGRVRPIRRETIIQRYFDSMSVTGAPQSYYFIGDQLYVHPSPDGVYTAVLDYLKWAPELIASTNEDPLIPQRHRRIITVRALIAAFRLDDDTEQAASFQQEYDERYQDMREDCLRSHYDEPDYIFVPDLDDYPDAFWG
jgi:hypothetical protein